jgi:hypothetical protein
MIDYTAAARAEAEEARTREVLAYLAELEAMCKPRPGEINPGRGASPRGAGVRGSADPV